MIKQIIKRDGSVEDFTPSKVNQWGSWAAKTLGNKVDWSSVVLDSVSVLPEKCSSIELQKRLIKTCLDYDSWSYNRMAGRLYAALLNKELYEGKHPTIKELHDKLANLGLMKKLNFTAEEYAEAETLINHKMDFKASYYELHQVREKYSIKNRVTRQEYESQQFTYMRMAMALAEDQSKDRKMIDVAEWYDHFSHKRINAPTPNYLYLGTKHNGLASCAVYTTSDDAKSLAIGDHIGYIMTCMSAGIGSHINTRSIGDPVRGGTISHMGKLPYFRAHDAAIHANKQGARGGAATTHYNAYDPEVEVISQLKNPMSTEDKRIRGLDYSMGANKFFVRKAAKDEEVFTFNVFTAPDLYNALYSGDQMLFESLYKKYEEDPTFLKYYVKARDVTLTSLNEAYETGRAYLHWIDEMNRHTPHKETIYSSNLCQELSQPTSPYFDMRDLYSSEDHGRGEISLCSLSAVNIGNIESDKQYEKVAYYALLMIDKCIHIGKYVFPHLEVTAKSRMNAGVGIVGLAYHMAKNKKSYKDQEGKDFLHEVAETHAWHCINASLRLGQELGNAPWMHKTKWPEGWIPLETYNTNVDSVVTVENKRDWPELQKAIIRNGGIRNCSLINYMPSESSSVASGTTNSLYPVRELSMLKSDGDKVTSWAAPEGERLEKYYELVWDIPTKDMIDMYAIFQKWTDQSISADLYRKIVGDDTVTSKEMLSDYFYMTKMGMKTRYYQNSKTSNGTELVGSANDACSGGMCSI